MPAYTLHQLMSIIRKTQVRRWCH